MASSKNCLTGTNIHCSNFSIIFGDVFKNTRNKVENCVSDKICYFFLFVTMQTLAFSLQALKIKCTCRNE